MTEPTVKPSDAAGETSSGLLERARARDQAAWERLVSLYTPLVYQWCRRAGLQPTDAADIGQEVFLAVARGLGGFRHDQGGDTFRGWLRRITQNKLFDRGRTVRRQEEGRQAAALRGGSPGGESSDAGLAEADEQRILCRRAVELVRREFRPALWQAFWRTAVDGQRPADVAAELNLTVNVVYLARSRVLGRLRQELARLREAGLL